MVRTERVAAERIAERNRVVWTPVIDNEPIDVKPVKPEILKLNRGLI